MSREYGMWTESWPLGLRFQHLGLVINHFFLRIDRWRTGSGTMGKGRTLGNAEQISRFLEAKSDNTSMKRKFTESFAHGGSSKVFKVGDGKRNWIVRERKSEKDWTVFNWKVKTDIPMRSVAFHEMKSESEHYVLDIRTALFSEVQFPCSEESN